MKGSMLYSQPATSLNPALIIYLLDVSHSMNDPCNGSTEIELVNNALKEAIKDMTRRSMRDGVVQRRYKVAVLAYNTTVIDITGGIIDLPELVRRGYPVLTAAGETDTAKGFQAVKSLLRQHIAAYQNGPAPLVCHLTDALNTASDPTSVIQSIQQMGVRDGAVLIENVYVAEKMLRSTTHYDWHQWAGVTRPGQLTSEYARDLFHLSSPLPDTYRQNINNFGYNLQAGSMLYFPGTHAELVRLAFAASTATQIK